MKKNKEDKRLEKELSRLGDEIEDAIEEERRAAEANAAPDADILFDDAELDGLKEEKKKSKTKPAPAGKKRAEDFDDEALDDLDDFDDEDFDDEDLDDLDDEDLDDLDDEDFDDEDLDDEDLDDLDDEDLGDEELFEKREKKRKKGFTALIAILTVLIVLLAGGAALWFMTGTKNIGFAAGAYTVQIGETQALEPVFTPAYARDKNYTIRASDGETVTFSDGKITGMKAGTVTLTALQNGKEYGSCTVTVLPASVASITFENAPEQLYTGSVYTPELTILPENAGDTTVEYTVSDPDAVTVEDGTITFNEAGSFTVTALNPASGVSASFDVEVLASDPEDMIINAPDVMELASTGTATVTFVPEVVADAAVIWSSSDSNVLVVDNGTLIARATGNAKLIATHASGLTKSVTVEVVPVQGKSIEITADSGNTLELKDKVTLTAVVTPSNAADKEITWTTSDENVATVSAKGVVVAKAAGEAEITASLKNGIKEVFKVSVLPKVVKRKAGFVTKPGVKTKVKATLIAPESRNLYISFQSTDGDTDKNFTVYVPAGKKLKTSFPEGSYYVTLGIGENWYGDTLHFYTEGEYFALKETFTITAGATLDCSMPGADDAFEKITEADFAG